MAPIGSRRGHWPWLSIGTCRRSWILVEKGHYLCRHEGRSSLTFFPILVIYKFEVTCSWRRVATKDSGHCHGAVTRYHGLSCLLDIYHAHSIHLPIIYFVTLPTTDNITGISTAFRMVPWIWDLMRPASSSMAISPAKLTGRCIFAWNEMCGGGKKFFTKIFFGYGRFNDFCPIHSMAGLQFGNLFIRLV